MNTCYCLMLPSTPKHTFNSQIVLERFFPKMLALKRKKKKTDSGDDERELTV